MTRIKNMLVVHLAALTLFCLPCFSQNQLWPTENAEWYYNYTDNWYVEGYSHVYIDRDTNIAGKDCQIYKNHIRGYSNISVPNGFNFSDSSEFICALDDSVLLVYSPAAMIFDTIIDFTFTLGDTWKTYIREGPCAAPNQHILNIITEVGDTVINGRTLKTWNIQRTFPDSAEVSEVFVQQMGSIYRFVHNVYCPQTDNPYENFLRCFYLDQGTPNAFSMINVSMSGACDYYPKADLNEIENEFDFVIYPNPIKGNEIILKNLPNCKHLKFSMNDEMGREIAVSHLGATPEGFTKLAVPQDIKGYFTLTVICEEDIYRKSVVKF